MVEFYSLHGPVLIMDVMMLKELKCVMSVKQECLLGLTSSFIAR